jgi:tRNA threonylcarbamoyl adenosine modification protein (Sua5/YciO/YrdC/YwlC family)
LSQYFEVHPINPQVRLIRRAADIVRAGGVIAYPTDSCYALGCHIGDKDALERLRRIRQADRHHHFTLVCRDLSEIGRYAKVDTWQLRLVRPALTRFCYQLPEKRPAACSTSEGGLLEYECRITRSRSRCSKSLANR